MILICLGDPQWRLRKTLNMACLLVGSQEHCWCTIALWLFLPKRSPSSPQSPSTQSSRRVGGTSVPVFYIGQKLRGRSVLFFGSIFQAHERDADGECSSSKGGVCTSRDAHERRTLVSAMSVSEEARDEPLYQRSVVSGRCFRGAAMASLL